MNTATAAPWIAPSILSAKISPCLGADVDAVLTAGADIVHFDVMNNHYCAEPHHRPAGLRGAAQVMA